MNRLLIYSSLVKTSISQSIKKIIIKPQQFYINSSSSDCILVLKDQSSIANSLNFSLNTKSPTLGTQIHAQIFKLGFSYDVFTQNNLIRMYSKCGYSSVGLRVFDEMSERNLVSWTLIISGAAQNGEFEMGFEAFLEMRRYGAMPNEFTLGSVFKICTSCIRDSTGGYGLTLGLCVHGIALKFGFEQNPFVVSSMINMYAKCGDTKASEKVFESVKSYGDVGCWNAMIGGYAQGGFGFESVKIASLMHSEGIVLDEYSFINAIKGCSVSGNFDCGEQIHGLIMMYGMVQSTSVMNCLMDMYFKNGRESCCSKLFNAMQHKDVVSWNIMFSGLSYDADVREIVSLFNEFMLSSLRPNSITFSVLINLCGEVCDPCLGLQYYCLALRYGCSGDSLVVGSLISMFSRCGSMEMTHFVYDNVPSKSISHLNYDMEALRLYCDLHAEGVDTSDITISCALEACLNSGDVQIGKQIHAISIKCGFGLSIHAFSSLIKLYLKYGLLDDSLKFFDEPRKSHTVTWSIMISVLGHQGHHDEAMKFLKYMKKSGERPDDFILSSVLDSSATLASHYLTKSVHSLVIKMGFELHNSVASAMIDAYSKCGELESAKLAFNLSSDSADVVVFNTMIMAYAHHGLLLEAMQIFEKMKAAEVKPSQATFVSVISACRHVGLVDLGRNLFESISLNYGMEPSMDNYGCLVDLLSRNGFIEDAKRVIEQMPFPPWPAIWRSFLNGCIIHGNRELGEWAYRKLFQFLPNDKATHILYLKLYSEHGDWEDAANLKYAMIDEGVSKDAGCSWIEV